MKLSVVIPVFNEEENIEKNLNHIIYYLKKNKIGNEIIVVEDGSKDATRRIVQNIGKENREVILTRKRENKGKGYSVKEGILMATGDYILFADADLSTPIEELKTFLPLIKKYDIVIGSRAARGARVTSAWYKILLGRIGNVFISWLAVKEIKDTQCGFKLFRAKIAREIFEKQTINRWGFDFEILHIAQKKRYSIKEQPVHWRIAQKSKVKLGDYLKTLLELIKIKINDIQGIYG